MWLLFLGSCRSVLWSLLLGSCLWSRGDSQQISASDERPNHYDKYDSKLYEECTGWLSTCESDWECCQPYICRWKPFVKTYRCEREYFFTLRKYVPLEDRSPPPPTHVPPPPKFWRLKDFLPFI
uniref:Uncharacterized protein n=1 Tax=Clastoptera arizonana TaxID=38151 RepID=A0A1B6DLG1_9HEMI